MARAQKAQGPPPIQTAKVKMLAIPEAAHDGRDPNIEQRTLDRIRKCLARAQYPSAPEAEAQSAWQMASRLMEGHSYGIAHEHDVAAEQQSTIHDADVTIPYNQIDKKRMKRAALAFENNAEAETSNEVVIFESAKRNAESGVSRRN